VRTRASLLAILVGAGAVAFVPLGAGATGTCARRLACVAGDVPAPITITNGRASFRVQRNGSVVRIPTARTPFPADAAFEGNGVWFSIRHRHLVIGREGRELWRSQGLFPSSNRNAWRQVGDVQVGPHAVAFSYANKLYLAPLIGAERLIGRSELAVGFTSGGLYTFQWNRRLLLRSDTGAVLTTIARWPFNVDFDLVSGTLYFLSHGTLMRAHGAQTRPLVSVRSLGLSANSSLQTIGPSVELRDDNRLVVLRSDGSLFASIPVPRTDGQPDTISSSLVVAPSTSAIGFTAAAGDTADPNTARRPHGTETVYLLRAGAHTATPVHTERVEFQVCERGAGLQWHGKWLLYSNSEGNLVLVDSAGVHRAIELSRLARRLLGARGGISAYWSGHPPEL
jgi:hypothetical protein